MLRGTDISHYQSSIPPGDFTILKATEGLTYVDASFKDWWHTLDARKKPRGAYHFFHPAQDPVAQADHFLAVVRAAGLADGDTLWLDHEALTLASPRRTVLPASERLLMEAAHFDVSSRATAARRFCDRVISKAGRCGVYTFLSFAEAGYCAGLGDLPLWMADPSRAAGQPRVPAPWSKWALHQYAETSGIDRDVFNGDAAAWRALGGVKPTPAPPTPHPSPTPTLEDDMPTGQLLNGANAATPITFKRGAYGHIGFAAGDDPKVPNRASLLVQVHDIKGWHDNALTVAAEDGQPIVKFPDPATTNIVRVVRTDGGDVPVAWEVS